MLEAVRQLVTTAAAARDPQAFWQAAVQILSEQLPADRVRLDYRGLAESGSVEAGHGGGGKPLEIEWESADGRRVAATIVGPGGRVGLTELQSTLEVISQLAGMVARSADLERERRLGTFIMELSRWLLAAPERDLMLRYTMQSVMILVDAQGAYVALRDAGHTGSGEVLRVVTALGVASDLHDMLIPVNASTTGRVVRSGEPHVTDNAVAEPDDFAPADSNGRARSAMIVPLNTSSGVAGAAAVVRYLSPPSPVQPLPFGLVELQYFTAVAAHIAGALELTQAVAATRAAANRAAAMVDASPLPLALVDPRGHVLQINQAGRDVFGLAPEASVVGQPIDTLGLSSSEVAFADVLLRSRTVPWHGRVAIVQPAGGQRLCDCTVTVLSGLGSDDILVALYDRTDELRAQRELIAREKLATVGEIASGVAHEVNNPLAAIRMEAELLQRATREPETDAAATTIVREVDRAARIVRSLLRLARRSDTEPTRVQVNDLIRDVAEIRQRVLRADEIEVRTKLDLSAPAILALGQELQQVVINLVTNAEHAVRGGGRKPAVIQMTTRVREGWVRLAVEDSGPGVPANLRTRIFDPFFTTKGPDEGTGLGLAICQRVVAEVGGKLWLEQSEELGGARFVVELPAAPERTPGSSERIG